MKDGTNRRGARRRQGAARGLARVRNGRSRGRLVRLFVLASVGALWLGAIEGDGVAAGPDLEARVAHMGDAEVYLAAVAPAERRPVAREVAVARVIRFVDPAEGGAAEAAVCEEAPPEPLVVLPRRAPVGLSAFAIDLPVPLFRQVGDKSNCGPTAAAMALGAYLGGGTEVALRDLRNAIGEWTWQRFPRRQRQHGRSQAGGTTRQMMQQSLNRFGEARWDAVGHAWLPPELWSVIALKRHLAERRPLVVLAEASPLWGVPAEGLHWVVVTGMDGGEVLINDPADGTRTTLPLATFWRAWRLPELYHHTDEPGGFEALVADRSLPARAARVAAGPALHQRLPPLP